MDTEEGRAGALADGKDALSSEVVRILAGNRLRFRNFLRRHVESDATAEDLLQKALLNAVRHGADWDGMENMLAWFYRILRNVLTDHYRSRASERRKLEALALEAADNERLSLMAEERRELCGCFEGLLPSIKGEYGDLIRRIDLGGEEAGAVAEALGISQNNLWVRLHRARRSLRASLEKICGICTLHGCLDCTCRNPAPLSR